MKRFQDVCKGKTLELHIWNPTFLLDTMERGEFDMVIGCRCRGDHGGRVLWTEPLVWGFARNMKPDELSPLPIALFPEPCPYRDAALAALASANRECRIVTASPSLGGLIAIAPGGLAVTPLNAHLPYLPLRPLNRQPISPLSLQSISWRTSDPISRRKSRPLRRR